MKHLLWCFVFLLCFSFFVKGQTEKKFNHQSLFWLASINTIRFNEHWGLIADVHFRTNNFLSHSYYYSVRGLANYWFNENLTAGFGYGHIWSVPTSTEHQTYSNENRITEQIQLNSKKSKLAISNRLRVEQRWQQKIVNDQKTNDYRFTNRVDYVIRFSYTPFKDKSLPSFTNFQEVMVQFGKEVVYNTFDQCRFYFGIRQNISPQLSVDIGYLYIYQQQFSGYQYNAANTLRLYFNYKLGWKKDDKQKNKSSFLLEDEH